MKLMLSSFEFGFFTAMALCIFLTHHYRRGDLKKIGIYAAITLSAVFIFVLIFVILPFSEMEMANDGFWQYVRDYSIAFRRAVIRPLVPIILTAVVTAYFTLAVAGRRQ